MRIASTSTRRLDILLWCVQALLALEFLGVSFAKFKGIPEMVSLFDAIGFGQWFRYVTAMLELTGAVMIVVPKTRIFGAALLAVVMLGAIGAHLIILKVPATAPAILLLVSSFVVWGRRGDLEYARRDNPGRPSAPQRH